MIKIGIGNAYKKIWDVEYGYTVRPGINFIYEICGNLWKEFFNPLRSHIWAILKEVQDMLFFLGIYKV